MKTTILMLAFLALNGIRTIEAAETGKIVVYYSGSFLGGIAAIEEVSLVTYNGHLGGRLYPNSYCVFTVAPGVHTLIARHRFTQDAIEVEVRGGETIYVEDHPGIAHWDFEVSDDQVHAKARVAQLKYQEIVNFATPTPQPNHTNK